MLCTWFGLHIIYSWDQRRATATAVHRILHISHVFSRYRKLSQLFFCCDIFLSNFILQKIITEAKNINQYRIKNPKYRLILIALRKKIITQGWVQRLKAHVKDEFHIFWTTSVNSFPQFERRHCCLSSPDGQPRSLAGPVCVREPLCLLKRSPPFSILVWQSSFYFSLDQVCFFLIFMFFIIL